MPENRILVVEDDRAIASAGTAPRHGDRVDDRASDGL